MQQRHKRQTIPGGFQMLLTPLRIALLVAVVLVFGLTIHLLTVITH